MRKKKKPSLLIGGSILVAIGFVVHSCLATVLNVYPNKGISFGYYSYLLILLAFLFLIFVWLFSWSEINFYLMIVAVGGTINFIDRMFFGYVRDYWSLFFVYNNLADWIVTVGVVGFIVDLWRRK